MLPFNVQEEYDLFELATHLIEDTNACLFITGKAGTGKSTFIRKIQIESQKNTITLAPTGIASINVGGSTLHSFFGFPLMALAPNDPQIPIFRRGHPKRKLIEAADTFIIDEVSMVRVDLIDAIDFSLRNNGGNPMLPFGGKQMVFVGDLFQLEPVMNNNQMDGFQIHEYYKSQFFFDANVFNECDLLNIQFEKVYRQTDNKFIGLLDRIRAGVMDDEDLQELNQRVFHEIGVEGYFQAITLSSTNQTAFNINFQQMEALKTKEYTYNATIEGDFPNNRYPAPNQLKLKEGAQVMFIKNDSNKRFVNGTIGKVMKLTTDSIMVRIQSLDDTTENRELATTEIEVKSLTWENKEYGLNPDTYKVEQNIKGVYKQIPLIPAWAVTIHKSQGLTFDRVIIDLGRGAFAAGQTYVALSRCRTLEGIYLKQKVKPSDIILNPDVIEFSSKSNNIRKLYETLAEGRINFAPQFKRMVARREEIKRKREEEKLNK